MMTRISDREAQMPGRIEGAVAVITGGAGGIGEGTARRFVAEGARCVIADLQDDAGARVADQIGALYLHCDVASEDDVAACVDAAVGRFGRLDCMFNNAGILGAVGPITEIDATAWHRSLDVLLSSVFFGIKHAARAMMRQGVGRDPQYDQHGRRAGRPGTPRLHRGQARRGRADPIRRP
jgi:NAD(P)-dependent dehydrogenase (short-subunit alcohol dehydrogenase family)